MHREQRNKYRAWFSTGTQLEAGLKIALKWEKNENYCWLISTWRVLAELWNAMNEQSDNTLRPAPRRDRNAKEQTLSKPIAVVCHWRCRHDVCNTKMKYTKWNWSGIIHGISLHSCLGLCQCSCPCSCPFHCPCPCHYHWHCSSHCLSWSWRWTGAQQKALLHICWPDTVVSLCRSLVGLFLVHFGICSRPVPMPMPMPGTGKGRKDQYCAWWPRCCYFCSLPMDWWCHQQKKKKKKQTTIPTHVETIDRLTDWLIAWLVGSSSATGMTACLAMSPLALWRAFLYIDVRCLAMTAHKV